MNARTNVKSDSSLRSNPTKPSHFPRTRPITSLQNIIEPISNMNLLSLLTFPLLFVAVSGDGHEDCSTIAEIACGTEGFETLCAAVTAAGLGGALSEDHYTVFAPTNDAFGNLPAGTVEALLDDIPALTNILLFHAVADHVIYSDDLHCTDLIHMANGKDSRTVCRHPKIFQKGAGNSRSMMPEIVTADIEACNGVVHVVSEVMLP